MASQSKGSKGGGVGRSSASGGQCSNREPWQLTKKEFDSIQLQLVDLKAKGEG